jgi:uncharacterized membrane protein
VAAARDSGRAAFTVLGWVAFAVMGAAQLSLGAVDPAGDARVVVNSLTVAAMALASAAFAAGRWGWRRAAAALVAVTGATLAAEVVGVRTGWPFGRYAYTGVLAPTLAGVPLLVPLAWFGMGLPARELAAALVGHGGGRRGLAVVGVGAAALTAWDLFLDPQMLAEGYWRWLGAGVYRGVPLSNFAGWLLVAAVVMVLLGRLLPAGDGEPALLGVYTWTAVAETVAFAALFGDPLVAAAGGLAMGVPAAAAWWVRAARRRDGRARG